jgi:hypothetical protein
LPLFGATAVAARHGAAVAARRRLILRSFVELIPSGRPLCRPQPNGRRGGLLARPRAARLRE